MSKSGRIVRWIAISVILQVAVLSYVNFIYLPNRGNISVSAFNVDEDTVANRSVRLPDGASDVSVSYNGLYAAYKVDNELEVLDIKARKVLKKLEASDGELSFFRWLPDRDILIYSVKEPEGKRGQAQLLTYDVDAGVERNYPKMTGLAENSEVMDIELSPLTNVVYFMVKTGDTSTRIYRYNIMDRLNFVMSARTSTVIKEATYEDYLIYCDRNDRIHIRNGGNSRSETLSFRENLSLLAVAEEDKIYAGVLDGSRKVESIYIGNPDTPEKEWKLVETGTAAAPEDIFIPAGGRIFTADRAESKVTEVGTSNTYKYKGELLDVLDNYVVALDGNKLNLTAVEKENSGK